MLPAIRNPAPAEPLPPDSFPRWVLLCGAGVIAFSLLSVALVRITGNSSVTLTVDNPLTGSTTPFPRRPSWAVLVMRWADCSS